jgi:thermitase
VRLEPARARALAKRAIEVLPGTWRVRPLAPQLGEYELVPGRPLAAGRAWTLARTLRRVDGVVEAEPLFGYAGLEPDPDAIDAYLAPHERPRATRASGSGETPRPCAASNPRWSLDAVSAESAWDLIGDLPPGRGVLVGHPDTGYTHHPELWGTGPGAVLPHLGYDYVDEDADALDPLVGASPGHGTATGSVILSPTTALVAPGVTGVAPAASLVPVRVSTSVVHFSFSSLTRALYRLIDHAGVHLVSMSLGGPFPSAALERALAYGIERGVIPLAAAGNVWPFVVYPARYERVIAVGASHCQGGKWSGSASGGAIDISAPGESVWRACVTPQDDGPRFGVEPGSGTSYAVATTAGACALWLAYHGRAALLQRYGAPALADVFRRVLTESGFRVPPGWDTRRMGVGIVDAAKLLGAPLPAAAAGIRSRAPRGLLESAIDYFPGDDPDRVVAALTSGVSAVRGGRAAAVRAALADLGDELLFHLGTSPALRARLHAEASGTARRARAKPAVLDASPAFRAKLGL